jgi:hypothetical protein
MSAGELASKVREPAWCFSIRNVTECPPRKSIAARRANMKIVAFACGMLLIIAGVMFIVTSYTLYEGGRAGAGSMFLFGLGIFIAGKFINHSAA